MVKVKLQDESWRFVQCSHVYMSHVTNSQYMYIRLQSSELLETHTVCHASYYMCACDATDKLMARATSAAIAARMHAMQEREIPENTASQMVGQRADYISTADKSVLINE